LGQTVNSFQYNELADSYRPRLRGTGGWAQQMPAALRCNAPLDLGRRRVTCGAETT